MKIRVLILVILLVAFGIQGASYGLSLGFVFQEDISTSVDPTPQTEETALVDTTDIEFFLRVTKDFTNIFSQIRLTVEGGIAEAEISPASYFMLASETTSRALFTFTIPRTAITEAGVGEYEFTITVTAGFPSNVDPVTITLTLAVLEGVGRVPNRFIGMASGRNQEGYVDEPLSFNLTVEVFDSETYDLYTDLEVTFGIVEQPTSDAGATLSEAYVLTDEDGRARTALTLGNAIGVYKVEASIGESDLDRVVFTATAIPFDSATITLDSLSQTSKTPTSNRQPEQTTHKVIFSEFMFESVGGEGSLPQWIEVYNNSIKEINLRGWKLHWKRLYPLPFEVTTTFKEDFIIPVQQSRLIVTSLGRHSRGGKLLDDDVYQLQSLHAEELTREDIETRNRLIDRGGFSLKLTNATDVLVDHIGTLTGDKQTWQLHECLIDGVRSSLIRRFDNGVPRSGTERRGWRRAIDAKRLVAGIYYGHSHDLGTPAYRRGKPLPVELSQFSARFVKDEVVINWTTESELNNAGFNILRSTSRTKNFRPINTKLIQGAGTTGERRTYQFIDATAKPNVAYYYRIVDVDFSGTHRQLTTQRVQGVIAPTGKLITRWSTLKGDR